MLRSALVNHVILAFETTENEASVALCDRSGQVHERVFTSGRGHGPALYAEAEAVLSSAGLTLADVHVFASSTGPGSFTGLRVGLSAAKAFAYAFGRPSAGWSSLDVLAENAPDPEFVCAVIDARKHEVYAALYERSSAGLARVLGPWVGPAADVQHRVAEVTGSAPVAFVGSGASLVDVGLASPSTARIRAAALAMIAMRHLATTVPLPPASAHYVRPAEAEVKFGLAPRHDPLATLITAD